MSKTISILIIDDHPSMIAGLQKILEQTAHYQVVGSADTGRKGLELVSLHQPAVVLLDLNLPDDSGAHVCSQIKQTAPATHVIIYTGYQYEPYFNLLLENGASGILDKNAEPEKIKAMVEAVLNGNTLIPLALFRQLQLKQDQEAIRYWEADLTTTEERIITMIVNQRTNAAIADRLNVSTSSVEKYLKKIYTKMGVRNKNQALAKIREDGRMNISHSKDCS